MVELTLEQFVRDAAAGRRRGAALYYLDGLEPGEVAERLGKKRERRLPGDPAQHERLGSGSRNERRAGDPARRARAPPRARGRRST